MWRDDAYILDMLIFARKAIEFNRDGLEQEFLRDSQRQYATQYALQVIGEAASKVSPEFRTSHPTIPWKQVIGLRHRLVHDYPGIELQKVWTVVNNHLNPLISQLEEIVQPNES